MITADKLATETTKELLQKIVKAEEQTRIISGVFSYEGIKEVYEATGEWACLMGVEYCSGWGLRDYDSACNAIDWKKRNPEIIEHWNNGGIIRVLSHFPNPCNPKYSGLRDKDVNINAVLTPDTPERNRWLSLLDEIAEGFRNLNEAGVSIIYGPLHEMNESTLSDSFWWGSLLPNIGVDGYKALWKDVYHRITDYNDCHNVLWLWSPLGHCSFVDEAYPGEDVVDMVGLDVYNPSILPFTNNYESAIRLGKPFILGEYGPLLWNMPANEQPQSDCLLFVNELRDAWKGTCAFMYWYDSFLPSRHHNATKMLQDPLVITRGKLV